MSGSHDRPPGQPMPLPPPSSPRVRSREDHYSHPSTGRPSISGPAPGPVQVPYSSDSYSSAATADAHYRDEPSTESYGHPEADFDELRADGRPAGLGRKGKARVSSGVVPAGSVTSRSLTLVIAIMCFLACLTAGGVYMINQSASAWLRDIAGEITVQLEPREGVETERLVQEVSNYLSRVQGVRTVKPLSLEASTALVEPWLGKTDALKALPMPRLIAIEVDRSAPPDMDALGKKLTAEFKVAALDDHSHWQQQIRTVTRSLALGGLAILMLVGAATTAIIISAARSAMASNREIVEVLHLVGATDRYIAREFERHFLRLGVKAGLVGAGFAMLVFLAMPMVMEMLGGSAVTMAELRRLFGAGALDLPGYGVLVLVVVVISGLCMLTSRFGVYRILDTQR